MTAHTQLKRFHSPIPLLLIALLAISCRPANEDSPECQSDNDCPAGLARCVEDVCVECLEAQDCECFETCTEANTCQALGASVPNESPNAHGNWTGTPGSEDYTFVDRCEEDADCSLGELCNIATAGCVLAADYPESCSSDVDCPRGPEGEILSCDLSRSLCLPAAVCVDSQQCCGRSGVVCSQTQGLCLPLQDECTPTPSDELESTCPLSPRATDECADGLFCSNDGQCVQCQCDEDCGTPALKCRIYDGTCVASSYCEQDADCETQEVCKVDVNECVDRCDPAQTDSCPPQSFCDEALLYCRNNSERPCVEDALAPNHGVEAAAPLTLSTDNEFVGEFALCESNSDFFLLNFEEASELQVFVSADERLEIVYNLLGSDNETIVASGFVGELGAELLTTTVAEPSTRILQVIPLNETEGFYTLNIATTPAELCEALGEPISNDTPETADLLWTDVIDNGCIQTTQGQQISFNCAPNSFNLCPGDVDYYTIDVPSNTQSRLAISSSSESIATSVYGPLSSASATLPEIQPTQDELGLRVFEFTPRDSQTFLVRVSDPTSRSALYTLNGELLSTGTCEEDLFDADSAATSTTDYNVEDAPGLNDLTPTNLFVQPGETSIETNVCLNDHDLFSIRSQQFDQFMPRGQNIQIDWVGATEPTINLNGQTESLPIAFVTTDNIPLDIELRGSEIAQAGNGTLIVNWQSPDPCTTPATATPSGASILEDGSGNREGSQTFEDPWCGFEDRWFLITQPADTQLEVMASSNQNNVRIEFHDESIRAIDSQTFDSPLTASQLGVAVTTLATPQLAYLNGETQSRLVYVRVSNLSGRTDSELTFSWRLFEDICLPDSAEEDDRAALATSLDWEEGGLANSGIRSACPGDDDWFELDLGQSTTLTAQVITPSATNLTFELYDGALNRLVWSEVTNDAGTQLFEFAADPMPQSPVYARMRSLLSISAYRLDLIANDVCVDDNLEPMSLVPLLAEQAIDNLKLCNDDDRFSLEALPSGTWNICVYFSHDEIDIDIGLQRADGETIALSATKEDLETIAFDAVEDQSYELVVYADPRSPGQGTYSALLQSAPCASQP